MREKLVLSAVLALAVACRLDKLIETPRPPGLAVAPSRVAESAPAGSDEVRPGALAVWSNPSRVLTWTAHSEAGAAWLDLTNATGATPDTLWFTLDPSGLSPGTHRDAIVFVPDGSAAPSVRVPVELRIDSVAPPTGELSVRVGTTGDTPDPNGYTVTVDGGQPRAIEVNDATTYIGLTAGSYTVDLGDIASNCTVGGGTSRPVTVSAGQTTTETFAVDCPTPPPPNQAPSVNAGPDRDVLLGVLFTLGASFSDPDNGPWSFTIDWDDGSSSSGNASSQGAIGGTHTYPLPGSYRIRVTVSDSRDGTGSDEMILTVKL